MTNNNTTKENTMFNSIKTFNGINEVFDSINSDMNVIGDIFSCDWDSSDIFDGVAVMSDWDGNDIYVNPNTNTIVGWKFYGCSVRGVDTIS